MKLSTLLNIADGAYYGEGTIQRAAKGKDVGDGLAAFIAHELADDFDKDDCDDNQRALAVRRIYTAITELYRVAAALEGDEVV